MSEERIKRLYIISMTTACASLALTCMAAELIEVQAPGAGTSYMQVLMQHGPWAALAGVLIWQMIVREKTMRADTATIIASLVAENKANDEMFKGVGARALAEVRALYQARAKYQ